LFITLVPATVIVTIIFGVLFYFTRHIKPLPKPIVQIQEFIEENEETEEEIMKIKFILSNKVEKPAIVRYPVFFELLDSRGGMSNSYIGPIAGITQNIRITRSNPGVWEFENFIENKRNEKSDPINQMMIKMTLIDSDGRKYCYCGFFRYDPENMTWNISKGNEFYIRYKRVKCMFCLFKNN